MNKGKIFSAVCAKSRNKKDCNTHYRKLLLDYDLIDGRHLILDSRFKNTTKALNLAKIPNTRIYVPNPYEKVNHPNWYDQSVGEFIKENNGMTFSSAYLDYCGTLHGNDDMCPLDDIKYLIENKMINGIMGVELHGRDPNQGGRDFRKWETIFKLIFEVEESAIETGYKVHEVVGGWCYKQMYVSWFFLSQ